MMRYFVRSFYEFAKHQNAYMSISRRTLSTRKRTLTSLVLERPIIDEEIDRSPESFEVINPANGEIISNVPDQGKNETEAAIDQAYETFQTWRYTTAKERSNLLRKWFDLCVHHQEDLAKLLTSEQGKPIAESRGEIAYGSGFLEWFSEEARRMNGETIPSPIATKQMLFIREPVGVAAIITPWNFPNAMITRKIGAALACGCTTVIKPSEDTPLSALAVAALAEEAGFPKGVINIVTTNKKLNEVSDVLCYSKKVAAMSFTGSTNVGKLLYKKCAGTVKRISLELGGNAPFIVFDSADVDLAVAGCMAAKFRNCGQACVAVNRVLVQTSVYKEFVAKLKNAVESTLFLGNGMIQETNQGPLINQHQFCRVSRMVNEAIQNGAKLECGGTKHDAGSLFYKPTILTNVSKDMEVFKEEIFGPVLAIAQFATEEEALNIANDCRVGLAGYFYSSNIQQCWRVAKKLEVGMVGINEGMISGAAETAYGGIKESGLGREGSKHGMDEYSEIKYLCFGNL